MRVTFWDYSPADLPRLIDARVRLRGNVGTLFGRCEQLRGVSLFVGRTSDVVVLESPPDPFSMPTRTMREHLQLLARRRSSTVASACTAS